MAFSICFLPTSVEFKKSLMCPLMLTNASSYWAGLGWAGLCQGWGEVGWAGLCQGWGGDGGEAAN